MLLHAVAQGLGGGRRGPGRRARRWARRVAGCPGAPPFAGRRPLLPPPARPPAAGPGTRPHLLLMALPHPILAPARHGPAGKLRAERQRRDHGVARVLRVTVPRFAPIRTRKLNGAARAGGGELAATQKKSVAHDRVSLARVGPSASQPSLRPSPRNNARGASAPFARRGAGGGAAAASRGGRRAVGALTPAGGRQPCSGGRRPGGRRALRPVGRRRPLARAASRLAPQPAGLVQA